MRSFDNFFESLFYNARQNAVMITDEEGIVTAINPAFKESFGYSEMDLIGNHANILFTSEDQKNGLFKNELEQVIKEGQSFDNNYFVNKDQTITWVRGESMLVNTSVGTKYIVKIIQDIHQQKLSEIEIRELNDFNENILGSIEDVVIVLDEELRILKINSAFAKLFRRDVPDISLINFADIIKDYDKKDELVPSIRDAFQNKTGFSNKQIDLEISLTDKRYYDISCSFMESSQDKNVLLIVHDITAYKVLEKEREDVMGFVVHELRNPLLNVNLCNELLSEALDENDFEMAKNMLQKSRNNVLRLQKMISELYESTKVTSGYVKLEISEFNFTDAAKEAIEIVEGMAPSYYVEVNGNTDISVKGDRFRLVQVLTNYLTNGIKYSKGKGAVILNVSHDAKSLSVSVRDEGLGISREQLPYVFDRFFRVEKTRNIEGIGLGLYLCRQIIHAHKGRVWAESEEGKGSIFYFSIPLLQ